MPARTRQLFTYVGLGLLEITPPAILLTLWGGPGAWGMLLLVVLGVALTDHISQQWVPVAHQRAVVAFVAGFAALLVVAAAVPGISPMVALFGPDSPNQVLAYTALLAGLYTAWRGLELDHYAVHGLRELFARCMGLTLLAMLIGNLGTTSSSFQDAATLEILTGFGIGLATVALARGSEPGEQTDREAGWQSSVPAMVAIALIVLLAIIVVTLLGGDARRLLVLIGDGLAILLSLLLLPIVFVLAPILEWLLRAIGVPGMLSALQEFTRELQLNAPDIIPAEDQLSQSMPWLGPLLEWSLRMLPIIGFMALIWWFVRRQAAANQQRDEERTSVFRWADLADDLRGLLARRRTTDTSLQAALNRLKGDDPDTRIRRSYLRMLIHAEKHGLSRPEHTTPREFLPPTQQHFPHASGELEWLTRAYEQARYHPGSSSSRAADQAEQIDKP
ncbi:MAG: hypothetical protein Fur005_42390 [Roseiflexaceae bacterium]